MSQIELKVLETFFAAVDTAGVLTEYALAQLREAMQGDKIAGVDVVAKILRENVQVLDDQD